MFAASLTIPYARAYVSARFVTRLGNVRLSVSSYRSHGLRRRVRVSKIPDRADGRKVALIALLSFENRIVRARQWNGARNDRSHKQHRAVRALAVNDVQPV